MDMVIRDMISARRRKGWLVILVFGFVTILILTYKRSPAAVISRFGADLVAERDSNTPIPLSIPDKIAEQFDLTGAVINSKGVYQQYTHRIKVSLVHSYSPQTEKHFREMMIDPSRNQHKIYANSPAILRTDTGEIITVMRIWLDKEIWALIDKHPSNTFSDNYFYMQKFDSHMRPVTNGQVIGIPTPIQWTIGDGPIEPRIFKVNGTVYLTFNTGIVNENQAAMDSTFLWDLDHSKSLLPYIEGGHPMLTHPRAGGMPRDKHWSAIVNGTRLYFTYNLDPLRIMECQLHDSAKCQFVVKEGPENYTFQDGKDSIRGGTPFILYKYPYYITVAHGTFFRTCPDPPSGCEEKRFYSTHMIVMTIEPKFKILYISNNIPYPKVTFILPIVRYRYIERSFFFPVGLLLENEDSIILGGHINDHSSVLYRITGISKILNDVMQYDLAFPHHDGPKVGSLHNYTRSTIEKETNLKFRRQ